MIPTIQTFSGHYVHLIDTDPNMINIEDIAHALSHLCRFTGHTSRFYSVAQHSILVSRLLPHHLQLEGLLHDATEAYLGDVSSPLKSILPAYQDIEHNLAGVLARRFLLELPDPQVKDADLRALVIERHAFMFPDGKEWSIGKGLPTEWPEDLEWIAELGPEEAKGYLIDQYKRLTNGYDR